MGAVTGVGLPALTGVRVVGFEACFSVSVVVRSIRHYEALGFTTSRHDDTYAFAHRDDLTVHLAHADDPATGGKSTLYLHVNHADQLAAAWRAAGMDVSGPQDYDYGKREGTHTDPDGNVLRFGSPLHYG